MEDRLNFSTPTGPYEGHENIAVDTLVDEDMADNNPTQEGMVNEQSLLIRGRIRQRRSRHGRQHLF